MMGKHLVLVGERSFSSAALNYPYDSRLAVITSSHPGAPNSFKKFGFQVCLATDIEATIITVLKRLAADKTGRTQLHYYGRPMSYTVFDHAFAFADGWQSFATSWTKWIDTIEVPRLKIGGELASVAVGIISHNYGGFVREAIQSVKSQIYPAAEIVVFDDASRDGTEAMRSAILEGVAYHRVEFGNVHQVKQAIVEATEEPLIVFLDADDTLPMDYLYLGAPLFADDRVAVVYSDCRLMGDDCGTRHFPETFDRENLMRHNTIHSGAIVRRDAIDQSAAFNDEIDCRQVQEDWFLWKRILASQRWTAGFQMGVYNYRRHGENQSTKRAERAPSYYKLAGLAAETITIAIGLSGRDRYLNRLFAFLALQSWPAEQVRLLLVDTSQRPEFHRRIMLNLLRFTELSNVDIVTLDVGEPGLAELERRGETNTEDAVNRACCLVYAAIAERVTTPYVWIIEDDIVPPDDAGARLLRSFAKDVSSVSGVYPSRYTDGWNITTADGLAPFNLGDVVQVEACGFGCVMIRRETLQRTAFLNQRWYDVHFWKAAKGIKLADWSIVCEHGGTDGRSKN